MATLFHKILLHEPSDHGPDGLFFAENGEIEAGHVTAALAVAFYAAGIFESPQETSLPTLEFEAGPVSADIISPIVVS